MSLILVFETLDGNPIDIGTPVMLDSGKVRPFDSQTDNKEDLLGVVSPKDRLSGREMVSGLPLFDTDYFLFTDFFQYAFDGNGTYQVNPNYDPNFDYITNDSYVNVVIYGLAGVLNSATKRSSWAELQRGSTVSRYFIRS